MLKAMLDRAGTKVIEDPVARQGGRRKGGSSVYARAVQTASCSSSSSIREALACVSH
jgi:hypothetical protein